MIPDKFQTDSKHPTFIKTRMKRILILTLILLPLSAGLLKAQTNDSITRTDTVGRHQNAQIMDYANPKKYVVRQVNLHGNNYYDDKILKAAIGVAVGDTIQLPGDYVSSAINKIWNMRYFSDAEIMVEPEGDEVTFDIYLTERPLVKKWRYEGIRKSQITDLEDNLKLKPGIELSDHTINKNKYLIKKYFSDKGYRNTEVTTRIANDSIVKNAVNVTFVIDRKDKVRIGAVNFIGNEVFPDKKLRKTFKKTNQVSINFMKSNKFKAAEFETDKENLLDFYNSKGYRNANILNDSIYDINNKRIGIDITVEEGNKFYYRNVGWVGNTIYATEDLNRLLGIEKGDTYDRKSMHKRLGVGREMNIEDDQTVSALYQNRGYLMSAIEPSEIIVGEDSLDLEIKIFEGRPFTINNVGISGNERVNDYVIRRELSTYPGELYNRSLIMSTIYRLGNMQHFNPEAIVPDIQPVSNELVDISWGLEEQPSDKVDISGGWGAGMFVGSVGIQLNNLSLRKVFQKGAWRPYPQGQNQQFTIRGQTNGTYYKALSLSFTEPWLGGKKPHSLTLSAYYSAENNAYYFYQKGTAFFRTLGVAAGIGFRLAWPDQYFTLYTEASYQRYMLENWNSFIISDGNSNIFALKTVFGRSSVSQSIFPRYGSDFSISLTLTPPYSLFENKDYKELKAETESANTATRKAAQNSMYGWIEYHRWMFKGRIFHPLTADQKLVLMAKVEMGYLGHYNPYKLSPFEGFSVGGDGMTGYTLYGVDFIGMRGYKDGTLIPTESSSKNDYARVYNKYTLEVRYPFVLQPRSTIYALVFAEAGNGYSSWAKFNPFQVKRSMGAGVRVYLPIVGMLGFDWGWGFDTPAGSNKRSGSQIHFTIGTEF